MVTSQKEVTAERFAAAPTYQQFVGQITQNKDEFDSSYQNTSVPDEYKQRLQAMTAKPNGPRKLLVLGEDWCPDVFRGLPVLQRIAEAAGIEMKVLPRDQNLDIATAHLNKGEFQSIPMALFLTDGMEIVMEWHERPHKADEEMPMLRELLAGRSREEAMPDIRKFRQGPVWAGWRDATVVEITESLEKAV